MAAKPLFVSLSRQDSPQDPPQYVSVNFNGDLLRLPTNMSLAAALLAAGVTRFRNSTVSSAPRAPYCMMGVCYECLVEIDDVPSQQACLTQARKGMRIRTMDTLPGKAFYDKHGNVITDASHNGGEKP